MSTYLPTIKQLQYLVALHEHGHFGRAADASFVSQSTLSAGIRELESLLGVVLVERSRRVVRFTSLGEQVVAKANKLLREAEELSDLVQAAGKPLVGPAAHERDPHNRAVSAPAPACRGSRRERPDLKLMLREETSQDAVESLQHGRVGLRVARPCPLTPAMLSLSILPTTGSMSPFPRMIRAIRRRASTPT